MSASSNASTTSQPSASVPPPAVAPPGSARPSGTSVATPVKAMNAARSAVSSTRDRSDVAGARVLGEQPDLEREDAVEDDGERAERGDHRQAGLDEVDRRARAAGQDRRDEEVLERPPVALRREHADPREQHDHRQQPGDEERVGRLDEPGERDEDDRHEDELAAREHRRRRGEVPGKHRRGSYVLAHTRDGLAGDPLEELVERQGVEHVPRLDPRAARLVDAPADVVELLGPVRVGVDRQDAARPRARGAPARPRGRAGAGSR